MEIFDGVMQIKPFMAVTIGIVVLSSPTVNVQDGQRFRLVDLIPVKSNFRL
jgi:hypothetical protein